MILTGIDVLLDDNKIFGRFKKIGLVSNSRAFCADGRINLDSLAARSANIDCIFSPEHGYFANIKDGDYIKDGNHPQQNIPILSLFTETHERNAVIEAVKCRGLDAVIFDIQDVGVRFYTYIHALGMAVEASLKTGVPLFVLDRPNPAGCLISEGNISEDEYISELCPFKIPTRYALSIGELALYLSGEVFAGARLTVIGLKGGYRRYTPFEKTGLAWPKPSPAMVSSETALFYPGTCFFEGVNISEGRGTNAPFQIIGAPFIDSKRALEKFENYRQANCIDNFNYIAADEYDFTPASSKYENIVCHGLRLTRMKGAPDNFRALLLGIILLKSFYDASNKKVEFLFSQKSGRFFIDRLAGCDSLRKTISEGEISDLISLYKSWDEQASRFSAAASKYFLY